MEANRPPDPSSCSKTTTQNTKVRGEKRRISGLINMLKQTSAESLSWSLEELQHRVQRSLMSAGRSSMQISATKYSDLFTLIYFSLSVCTFAQLNILQMLSSKFSIRCRSHRADRLISCLIFIIYVKLRCFQCSGRIRSWPLCSGGSGGTVCGTLWERAATNLVHVSSSKSVNTVWVSDCWLTEEEMKTSFWTKCCHYIHLYRLGM